MIKFFRRIRKRFLSENKFTRYLIYAIGEIILVVIGILIALYINNKNESRIENNAEKQYLISLKDEFLRNKDEVKRVLASCKSILQSGGNLANWAQPDSISVSNALIEQNLAKTFAEPPKFIQSPGILNDLISSGNLNKISSDSLRLFIQQWIAITKDVEDEEFELWRHRFNVMDLMNEKISFKGVLASIDYFSRLEGINNEIRFSSNSKELLQDRKFENLLLFYFVNLNALRLIYYPRLNTNINAIIEEIDAQLE